MDEWLARLIMVVETVGLVCITGFAAYWMKLRHQRKLLADQSSLAHLEQQLDELRTSTQAQLTEIQERLDFSERLLLQRGGTAIELPRTPTPV